MSAWLLRLTLWGRTVLTPTRLSWYLGALLLPQVVLFLAFETRPGVLDRQGRVRGRDFIAFYVWGHIVLHGNAQQVYQLNYFQQVQESIAPINFDEGRPPANPLYPPTTGLLFCALALLPYEAAIVAWWLVLLVCFAAAFALLLRWLQPAPAWRSTAILALAAFTPVSNTFVNGQLAGLFLLALIGGIDLHRRGQPLFAGLVLSLLAFKPQLVVGPGLWLLLRLDWRSLLGLALGVLLQVDLVAATLGLDFFDLYAKSIPQLAGLPLRETIDPDHQHALAGILGNLLGSQHADVWKMIHGAVTFVCAGLLFVIVRRRKTAGVRLEYAAVGLLTVFAPPHLHTYDVVLLLVPIVQLLTFAHDAKPREEVALAALLYLTGALTFVYWRTHFSLVPAVIVLVLARLAGFAAKQCHWE